MANDSHCYWCAMPQSKHDPISGRCNNLADSDKTWQVCECGSPTEVTVTVEQWGDITPKECKCSIKTLLSTGHEANCEYKSN